MFENIFVSKMMTSTRKGKPGMKDKKKRDELRERQKKVMEIRTLDHLEEQWMKPQLKAMCLCKKAPGDKGLPDSLPLLQRCWHEWKGRLSPPMSPLNLDDESTEDESISCLELPAVSPTEKHQRCRLPSF
jgi:hypothetical protein